MGVKLLADNADFIGGADANRAGRWRINAGSEMIVAVPGLNDDKKGDPRPVRLVIDFTTCTAKSAKITALSEHKKDQVIGYWDKFSVSNDGVEADLHLVTPQDEREANVLAEAVRIGALVRAGVPIQVSVGAEAGDSGSWEEVPAGTSVSVNGRQYSADGDLPLYILRGGQLYESSIVTFGADSETGRVAAAKITPVKSETPMSDKLKALLGKYAEKHHGLVARCVAEDNDEISITAKVHAAEIDDRDAKIKALEEENTALKGKCAELEAAKADDYGVSKKEKEGEKESTKKVAASASDKGVAFGTSDGKKAEASEVGVTTMSQAMKVIAAKNDKLTGFALRRAARAAYPNAEEK